MKREREREVVLAKTKIECEKRQQEEEENVPLSAGARFQSRCLLFQRERDGFANFNPRAIFYAIPSPIILYPSRQPLNNNYLHTHSTAIINLRRDSIIGEEKEA